MSDRCWFAVAQWLPDDTEKQDKENNHSDGDIVILSNDYKVFVFVQATQTSIKKIHMGEALKSSAPSHLKSPHSTNVITAFKADRLQALINTDLDTGQT